MVWLLVACGSVVVAGGGVVLVHRLWSHTLPAALFFGVPRLLLPIRLPLSKWASQVGDINSVTSRDINSVTSKSGNPSSKFASSRRLIP